MKTICLALDRDHQLNIPIGAVLRLEPMPDEDGQIIGYWIIDDATDEPLDLVSARVRARRLRERLGGKRSAPRYAASPEPTGLRLGAVE